MASDKGKKSKALLDLETDGNNSIESKLLFYKKDDLFKSRTSKQETSLPADKKPDICAIPESQVLGKLKDFLGVISESNKRLQCDAKDNSQKYNIEELSGNESEYIEMDLMLGVADLHTPEAVAAAESAISGSQPVISLAAGSSDGEDDDVESDDDDDSNESEEGDEKTPGATVDNSSNEAKRKNHSKKRPKIIELP